MSMGARAARNALRRASSRSARRWFGAERSAKPAAVLLYDGDCPLCVREILFLQKRDVDGTVRFQDIASVDYDEAEFGVTFKDGMEKIHFVDEDRKTFTGVAAFREVYSRVGLGWLWAVTAWPLIGPAADAAYDFWARQRLWATGRPERAAILEERQRKVAERQRELGPCETKGGRQ